MRADNRRRLKQLIAVQSVTTGAVSGFGVPTYAAARQLDARVEPMSKTFDGPGGTEVVTDTLCVTETEIKLTDKVWLPPDGDVLLSVVAAKARVPAKVFKRIGLDGTASHFESHF